MADDVVAYQVFTQELLCVGMADVEYGTKICDGHHIRVAVETLFVIMSRHDRFSFFGHVIARPVRRLIVATCAAYEEGGFPYL